MFLTALLNSQPMGFYTPSQLLQDAKRRGVQVLPVNVTVSTWDSAIEGPTTSAPVRLGFSLLRGMREDAAGRIELARAVRPFVDAADLARRARLDRHDLQVLARTNASRRTRGEHCSRPLLTALPWVYALAVSADTVSRNFERQQRIRIGKTLPKRVSRAATSIARMRAPAINACHAAGYTSTTTRAN
ncbi:hypothetical protein WI87_32195 [Burkholderia ubonensis]|nr:hypothetical protein WI87_32195 [Burkholderia ubonensis]